MSNLEENILKVVRKFGLEGVEVFDCESGYRNKCFPVLLGDGRKVNVVFYKNDANILSRIKNANAVSDYLAKRGIPTRRAFTHKENAVLQIKGRNLNTRYICVYNYLDGNTIPWEGYTSKHIKLLGGKMGEIHKVLAECKLSSLPDGVEEIRNLNRMMEKYFEEHPVKEAIKRKLNLKLNYNFQLFNSHICKLTNLQTQPLHLDFVRGNILFKTEPDLYISGILDFEKVAFGPQILDIARTLAFLIIDCKFKKEEKVRKYFLYNGYQKRGSLSLPDLSQLEDLLRFYWMYDFYKFLKHNPYEFLCENEHFVRTRDKLVKINVLKNI